VVRDVFAKVKGDKVLIAKPKKTCETNQEKVRLGMIENARRGNYNSGIAPFGYEIVLNENNKKQLIINDKEAEAVMIIFKRASEASSHISLVMN